MATSGATIRLAQVLLLFSFWCFVGCASLVSKPTYVVQIESFPEGAKVTIENETARDAPTQRATTPCRVKLSSHAGFARPACYSMTFEKDGYFTEVKLFRAKLSNWFFGNLVFSVVSCSFVGMAIVDPATGAMWRLDESVCIKLSPLQDGCR